MSEKGRILKNTMKNSFANIINEITGVLQGLFVANILGPNLYGLKNGFSLFQQYGNYTHLGVFSVYYRSLCEKVGDVEASKKLQSELTGFTVLISIILLILFALISQIVFSDLNSQVILTVISFCVISSFFHALYGYIFFAKQDFNTTSKAKIFASILSLILVVILTYFFRILGFFLALTLINIYLICYYLMKMKYIPRVSFNIPLYWLFMKQGFFNFINNLAYLMLLSVDRIIIIFVFGATSLGFYAIGLFFSNLVQFALQTIITPLVPNIYTYSKNKSKLVRYVIVPENIIYRTMYYFVFVIIFLSPLVVFILPQYAEGIVYIEILVFATIFLPLLIFNMFFALRKDLITMYVLIAMLILSIALNLTVVYLGLSMLYIAFATLITLFLYGNIMHLIGYKYILGSWSKAIKEICSYLWPLAYALVGYGLLWMLAHFWLYSCMNYYIVKVVQALLFTIWYSPILWNIEKKHKIIKLIWIAFKKRIGMANIGGYSEL